MPTKVYEFVDEISYSISTKNIRGVCRALNKHYTGKETIPLDEKLPATISKATHMAFATTCGIQVIVEVYDDGSIKLKFPASSST